ncbi:DUF3299 domain-containing protein [Paralimibaculum aggregatum]|uniref:DUF3299 domain-containing protein n=1 Tax=Paralimibaculum aggregatum TaxID=3036245 RepID=A0ABQ6LIT6_9RHOB|nr:DUF3299 domain-containing protein [Limibaculum sp. NKW23]GMG82145.1 DUF3299 domain-containing protein [Limibaculum sp. NKW23]
MDRITRRHLIRGSAALLAAAGLPGRAAETPLELDWADLIPPEAQGIDIEALRQARGIIEHGELSTGFEQERDAAVTEAYNGKRVRLPGFVVPLDFEGTRVTNFLLVPYVGACIHVPPPPPNQIVYVRAAEPFEIEGYFDAVLVTGVIGTMATATALAEIGYEIAEAEVEPYD